MLQLYKTPVVVSSLISQCQVKLMWYFQLVYSNIIIGKNSEKNQCELKGKKL